MKKIISVIFFSGLGILKAQQSFFSVPSGEVTPKDKVFYQQEVSISSGAITSNATLILGLGKGLEAGINLRDLAWEKHHNRWTFHTSDQMYPYAPMAGFNLLKRFDYMDQWATSIGIQQQFSLAGGLKPAGYYFINQAYHNKDWGLKYVLGMYYTTDGFAGEGKRLGTKQGIGIHSGIEQNLWHEKILFQADFVSGTHNLGILTIGGAWVFRPKNVLSIGWQLPNPGGRAPKGLLLEYTFIP